MPAAAAAAAVAVSAKESRFQGVAADNLAQQDNDGRCSTARSSGNTV
jgi:hypothetical protein